MEKEILEAINALKSRNVELEEIVDIVMFLQEKYNPQITREKCKEALINVLSKREVQSTILLGIEIDMLAENDLLKNKKLQSIILEDAGLFGLDEVLAYSICNLFGSIALTNFGYVDKEKFGVIARLNDDKINCHTFLDDIVGAIAASAASRLAHYYGFKEDI